MSVSSLLYVFFQWSLPYVGEAGREEILASWHPNAEAIAAETEAFRGGWRAQMSYRVPAAFIVQTFLFLLLLGWRAGGLMLVGMALYRWSDPALASPVPVRSPRMAVALPDLSEPPAAPTAAGAVTVAGSGPSSGFTCRVGAVIVGAWRWA